MAVQIILKNSSVEDKRPQASQLTNGEISLNYSSAGAFLCCTDTNGDVQQVGGVKIDETAPDAPVKQTLWFKPSTLTLSVFDGDKWLPIAGGGGGGGGGGGDIIQIIGNDGIDADTVSGIVTLDVELAGGDDGLEFKSSKLSATLASATDLGSVKVGDNINVTAGKISVPKATSSTFGVVKLGDGIEIDGDGSISIDVPTTTVYRGSCDLNNPPTGQINPDPALKGDAYINSADAPAVDAGWTGITGSAKIGDLVIFDGTTWDLIPLGSGEAPVTSVNGKTGDVVLDYTDVGAASEAQGELADTALQPGDNISELNNDEGYITAAEAPVQSVNGKTGVVVLDAADVGALAPGDNVSLLVNDAEYISKGDNVSDLANDAEYISKGDPVSDLDNDAGYITLADLPDIPDQEPPVIISDTAPTGDDAVEGNLWFNSNDGRTYVYYKDGDSSQWVDASPDSGGAGGGGDSLWLEGGGYLSPKTGTNGVDIGSSKILLNADGSLESTVAAGLNFDARKSTGGVIQLSNADGTEGSQLSHTSSNEGFSLFPSIKPGVGPKISTDNDKIAIFGGTNNGSNQIIIDDEGTVNIGGLPDTEPNIELNATDGSGKFEGSLISGGYNPAAFNGFGIRHNVDGQATQINQQISTNNTINHKAYTLFYGESTNETVSITAGGRITAAGNIQSTSQNGSQLAGFRNQLINGSFQYWQRSEDTTSAGSDYKTADRWYIETNGINTVSKRINIDSTTNALKDEAPTIYGMRLHANGAPLEVRQCIELEKTGATGVFKPGTKWFISWYSDLRNGSTGNDGTFISCVVAFMDNSRDAGVNTEIIGPLVNLGGRRWGFSVEIQSTPPSTATCLRIDLITANVNEFEFTAVQLEPGPVATPFEHRPIGTELALCQRYYQRHAILGKSVCMHNSDAATETYTDLPLPTSMRTFAVTASPDLSVGNAISTTGAGARLQDVQYANTSCARLRMLKLGTSASGPTFISLIGTGIDTFKLDAEI